MFGSFGVIPVIIGILFFCFFITMFVLTFGMIFSPKLRSKFVGHQLKMQKQMLDDNKDVIKDINELGGSIGIKAKKNIIDNNADDIEHIATKSAKLNKDAIKTTAAAIKEGFSDNKIFCKHCGESIDEDSTFCKICGKKQ